jgi:AcrR family transcriptional regulator
MLRKKFTQCGRLTEMVVERPAEVSDLTSPQRILERAIQVIEEAGETAIRTNPIAFECGVTPPILYRAFGSREGLIIAAQAERYRRSTAQAAKYLCDSIASATSRESLVANVGEILDLIFSPTRAENRRLRVEVIGSSVSRPELRQLIAEIDKEYAVTIALAYQPAVDQGWMPTSKNFEAVALWAQGLVNTRYMFDETASAEDSASWNQLTRQAIMTAIFD